MAAAAYKGTISFQGIDGTQITEDYSCSDVANAYATFDATGLTFLALPVPASIVDNVAKTGGTDTLRQRYYMNGKDTGLGHRVSSILDSINNRVPLPLKFGNPKNMSGGNFQIKQLA